MAWAAALSALALATALAADRRGVGSRTLFEATAETGQASVAMVGDAASAYRVWSSTGLHGRRLLVLSGQWSKPRNLQAEPPTPAELEAARQGGDLEMLDARSALFSAGRAAIVRRLDVVMPPVAYSQRLAQVMGEKTLIRGDGAFVLPYQGMERTFSTPRGFAPPGEAVLVLVEPSWFADGAPPDPLGWLAGRGVRWDLALLALEDPAARREERQAALAYAQAIGASFWEVAR